MNDPSGGTQATPAPVTLWDVERDVPPGARFVEIPPSVLGYRVFLWLLGLSTLLFLALAVFAGATYPHIADVRATAGTSDLAVALTQSRADWLNQVKDLGQLFLVTPILPLLGTVIGYMFGRHETLPGKSK